MKVYTVTMIDPADGHLFGFPKPIPKRISEESNPETYSQKLADWLVNECGYPESYLKYPARHWYTDKTEEELKKIGYFDE